MNRPIRKTILLVEDDASTAKIETHQIERGGCAVITAATGEEAVQCILRDTAVDLILMDIILGEGIDGAEAAKQILAIRNIPIIFLSAYSEKEIVEKVRGISRYGYVLKNSDGYVLQSMIEMAFELFEVRNNYESFFNTIDEFLFVLDEQGNIIHTNTTVNSRLGYTSEELFGKSVLSVHPAERRDEAGRIVGEMLQGTAEFCPVPIMTKSGDSIPVETRVKQGIWNGKPVIFGVTKDISRIKLSEEKFSKIFYLNPSACGVSDLADARYVEVNDAFSRLLGFEKDEVVGRTVTELGIISHETRSKLLQKADSDGKVSNAEVDLRSKNGDIKHVLVSAENIYVQDKKYRFTIVHDITERKRMEEALRHAQKMESLGVLAGGIAHDFNNLLGMMMGNVSLAQERLPAGEKCLEYLKNAMTAIERAADLTKKILAYSGKGKFQILTLDIAGMLREQCKLITPLLPKNIILETRLPSSPVKINGDPGQIEQLLSVLIGNGIEAIADQQGRIVLEVSAASMLHGDLEPYGIIANTNLEEGDYALIRIADNGAGMKKEIVSKIFDPFFSTKFIGRGLGLPAALGIVRGHAGGIKVESAEGAGTAICIVLPIEKEIGIILPETAEKKSGQVSASAILVIDDEIYITEVVRDILEMGNYQVVTEINPRKGAEIFLHNWQSIGAVLLDLSMPEMSGREVLIKMRQINPKVKVILSSGYSEDEAKRQTGDLHPTAFIQKPYTFQALISIVQKVLGSASGAELSVTK